MHQHLAKHLLAVALTCRKWREVQKQSMIKHGIPLSTNVSYLTTSVAMFEWGVTLGSIQASLTQSSSLFDIWPMCAVQANNYYIIKWLHERGFNCGTDRVIDQALKVRNAATTLYDCWVWDYLESKYHVQARMRKEAEMSRNNPIYLE